MEGNNEGVFYAIFLQPSLIELGSTIQQLKGRNVYMCVCVCVELYAQERVFYMSAWQRSSFGTMQETTLFLLPMCSWKYRKHVSTYHFVHVTLPILELRCVLRCCHGDIALVCFCVAVNVLKDYWREKFCISPSSNGYDRLWCDIIIVLSYNNSLT